VNLLDLVLVGAAGSGGALVRYLVDGAVRARRPGPVPWGTFTINLSGSLLLGFLTGLVLFHAAPSRLTVVAGTGFCGGYTTFSTASFETVRLLQDGHALGAWLSGLGTLVGATLLAAAGLGLAGLV
jgi:CrcB protein